MGRKVILQLGYAMNADGTADLDRLHTDFGDELVPVKSANGVHIMGLSTDGSGIVIRWKSDFNGEYGTRVGFRAYYNNDFRNPGGDGTDPAAQTGQSSYFNLGGNGANGNSPLNNSRANNGWSHGQQSIHNGLLAGSDYNVGITGPQQTTLYMPVNSSQAERYFSAHPLQYPSPGAAVGLFGPMLYAQGYSGYFWWSDESTVTDVTWASRTSLSEVVEAIDDPDFEYHIKVTGKWAAGDTPTNFATTIDTLTGELLEFRHDPIITVPAALLHPLPDEISPEILLGDETQMNQGGAFDIKIDQNDVLVLDDVTVIDDHDGDITTSVKVNDQLLADFVSGFDTSIPGDYLLMYSAVDAAGNITYRDRSLKICALGLTRVRLIG